MKRALFHCLLSVLALAAGGCAGTPQYLKKDCPLYNELGPVRANPAGALDQHLQIEAVFKVCPPVEGLAELRRKRIELKHNLLDLISAKTEAELKDPLRVEKIQEEIRAMVNEKIMRRGRVIEVFVTAFEYNPPDR